MKYFFILFFPIFLVAASISFSPNRNDIPPTIFNPHAGVIIPLSNTAKVTASSNSTEADKVSDGNLSTAWVSEAPLPEGFIKNKKQNILLGKSPNLQQGQVIENADHLTDGDLNNSAVIPLNGQKAFTSFALSNSSFFSVSVKCQATSDISVSAEMFSGEMQLLGTYLPANNYQLLRFEKTIVGVKYLYLSSNDQFDVFEIAALTSPPREGIIFQFDKPQKIGVLKGKLWAGEGTASATHLYLSNDGINWNQVAKLPPESTHELLFAFPDQKATFVKIEHTLVPKDWNKVFIWEVKIYDKNGPFGEKPLANQGAVSLRQMLGVNGYWSWGTDQYSYLLGKKEGPRRYAGMMSHARNYHDMTWDITDPDQAIDFSKMKDNGTPAKEWVNWDLEYADWKKAGMDIQASLQFYRFDPKDWNSPQKSAYQYAFAFANHFGPKNGNGLVCTIEAGNEPWKYPSNIYQEILKGIIKGAKDADPTIEVFPCALQAADPEMENTDVFKNYIGTRINEAAALQLDGVNTHIYSYITDNNGNRRGIHPECPMSSFWEINNLIKWRNHNMPGKKIYLSEWGWDCGGGGEDCNYNECVSEEAAAAYAVRGALIAARLGLERATWYYYANEKAPASLYTRSGLTSSVNANFQKKKPFNSLDALINKVGDGYFLQVIQEDETAWLYLFGDKTGHPTHLVAWLPIESNSETRIQYEWSTHHEIESARMLDGIDGYGTPVKTPVKKNKSYLMELSSYPIVFSLKQ